jgi:hypothetical protein
MLYSYYNDILLLSSIRLLQLMIYEKCIYKKIKEV